MAIVTDMHVHSDNSPDASDPVMLLCERAVERELMCLAVTDHCEINEFYQAGYGKALKQSYFDVLKAKAVFGDRLCLINGIELGQATQDRETAEKVVGNVPYDYILGSLHNIKGKKDFAFLDYENEDVFALFDSYLDEILQLAQWGGFDVLAHLTYPLRYIVGEHKIPFDPERCEPKIRKIMSVLVAERKGLEINTSGLRQAYGALMPEEKLLELYKSAGGEILTIGSDSHRADDIGSGFDEGRKAAKQAGFTKIAYYLRRKPYFIDI